MRYIYIKNHNASIFLTLLPPDILGNLLDSDLFAYLSKVLKSKCKPYINYLKLLRGQTMCNTYKSKEGTTYVTKMH